MFVYQTLTRGRSVTLLNEHAQFGFRYCSPVADRTRSVYNDYCQQWSFLCNIYAKRPINGAVHVETV